MAEAEIVEKLYGEVKRCIITCLEKETKCKSSHNRLTHTHIFVDSPACRQITMETFGIRIYNALLKKKYVLENETTSKLTLTCTIQSQGGYPIAKANLRRDPATHTFYLNIELLTAEPSHT